MINEFNITSAEYQTDEHDDNVCIQANIDGQLTFIPLDMDNRHYAEIMRQVEAGVLTIEEAAANN